MALISNKKALKLALTGLNLHSPEGQRIVQAFKLLPPAGFAPRQPGPPVPFTPVTFPRGRGGGGIGDIIGRVLPGVLEIFRGRIPPRPTLPGGIIPSMPTPFPTVGECPKGFHQAKDGSGRCVRNRRMNSLNPRALRRCLRRIEGFQNFVKRSGLTVSPRRGRRKPKIQIVHKGAITEV